MIDKCETCIEPTKRKHRRPDGRSDYECDAVACPACRERHKGYRIPDSIMQKEGDQCDQGTSAPSADGPNS